MVLVHVPFSLQYNNHEIRSGKLIGVCISVANNRLFVGSIPKSKTKEQIVEEFSKVTGELVMLMYALLHAEHLTCVLLGLNNVQK